MSADIVAPAPTGAEGATVARPLVRVTDLVKSFPITEGVIFQREVSAVQAVTSVTLNVHRGETLGLVGESGCGKTTLGRTIARLYEPTAGTIEFDGRDISKLSMNALRPLRKEIQVIYQDPFASLNPRMRVGEIVGEPLVVHKIGDKSSRWGRVQDLLELVGLSPEHADRYPHEFSGGQRQRVGIARALAVEPSFIVCDEAVSALDVSVQAQILNLLNRLKRQFELTYLFISHDLGVIRHICDRVAVMYLGGIVELAVTATLFSSPQHPYTQALLSAVPVPDPSKERTRARTVLRGDLPSPSNPPSGCRFHTRCPVAQPDCSQRNQRLTEISPGHWLACYPRELALREAADSR